MDRQLENIFSSFQVPHQDLTDQDAHGQDEDHDQQGQASPEQQLPEREHLPCWGGFVVFDLWKIWFLVSVGLLADVSPLVQWWRCSCLAGALLRVWRFGKRPLSVSRRPQTTRTVSMDGIRDREVTSALHPGHFGFFFGFDPRSDQGLQEQRCTPQAPFKTRCISKTQKGELFPTRTTATRTSSAAFSQSSLPR